MILAGNVAFEAMGFETLDLLADVLTYGNPQATCTGGLNPNSSMTSAILVNAN